MPSILCLNDQGGSVMECSLDITGTLGPGTWASALGLRNHGIDSRYTGPIKWPTMSTRGMVQAETMSLVEQEQVFCITGNCY